MYRRLRRHCLLPIFCNAGSFAAAHSMPSVYRAVERIGKTVDLYIHGSAGEKLAPLSYNNPEIGRYTGHE
jgi:hypothetical protein